MHGMYAGNERRNRMVALVLAIVLVAGVVLALLATVVQAAPARASTVSVAVVAIPEHASLVSVSPADGAELSTGPTQIRLTFDDVVSAQFLQLRLTRDGSPVATSTPTVDRAVVTAEVSGKAEPGAYRLVWQVTSDDGHPVSGESTFTVLGAGATPRVTPSYKTPQTQPTTVGHPDHLPGLIVAGVLLLGGIALLWYEHRRRSRSSGHDHPPSTDVQDRQRIS